MTSEDILDRLRKMKALADRGVGGERANAQRLLATIAAEHGISLDQLDDDLLKTFRITLSHVFKRKLLNQLCALKRQELKLDGALTSDERLTMWTCRKKNLYAIKDCTDAEWVELTAKLEILARAYKRQEDEFYSAFLFANNLLVEAEGPEPELSLAERQRLHRVAQMSMGIERTHIAPMIGYR